MSAFDGQLCITQRLLYGARPYDDVIAFADSLAAEAERLGAARGRAFAVTIRGEAQAARPAELDGAEADLREGARLHRELGGATGEAFALQRRAEVAHAPRPARRRPRALLDEALGDRARVRRRLPPASTASTGRASSSPRPGARSPRSRRPRPRCAGPIETCPGCRITLAVPAAIAAARAGDDERADEWQQRVGVPRRRRHAAARLVRGAARRSRGHRAGRRRGRRALPPRRRAVRRGRAAARRGALRRARGYARVSFL